MNVKKRTWWQGFLFAILALFLVTTTRVNAEEMPSMMDLIKEYGAEVNEADKPKSAILIDGNTGKILWSENPETPHNPASIMKLMVIYLTYEAMSEGKFNLETTITATERHQQMSQIYAISNNNIVAGVAYPVKELIGMALVPSSNVATMMLAEQVEPDAVSFLALMNQKAKELGMKDTTIVNATGAEISAFDNIYALDGVDTSQLDMEGSNVSTAQDFSIFTYHLLKNFPEVLEYMKTPTLTVMKGTPYEETFDTYNYSLAGLEHAYEGVDGLKTGSSSSGAFNIDITAQRDDLRLIALVLGVGSWDDQTGEYKRHPFANAIVDYGFKHFEYKEILPVGEYELGKQKLMIHEPVWDVVRKGEVPEVKIIGETEIELMNPLPQVSPTIPPVKGEIEKIPDSPVESIKKETTDFFGDFTEIINPAHPIVRWILIIMGIILFFIVVMIVLILQNSKKRKRARQNRGEKLK